MGIVSTMELLKLADELSECAKEFEDLFGGKLRRIMQSAVDFGKSWSGSNIGYHSNVYYKDLKPKPAGAHFSMEWGLKDMPFTSYGSVGEWEEYDPEEIKGIIFGQVDEADLNEIREKSFDLKIKVEGWRSDILSNLAICLGNNSDEYVEKLLAEVEEVKLTDANSICAGILSRNTLISRDELAVSGGVKVAPHQEVYGECLALLNPADCAGALSKVARKAGSHMERKGRNEERRQRVGTNVFIGHGRSHLWRELKDFIVDRLSLPYEEFNRVPVAGVTNIARLSEMLDGAGCAIVLLTAEDEHADGGMRARMNVIHEVGLFQGRLGFTKAIILLEEGCEEFSNIQGLGQIRFPRGNVAAAFEEVRAVLEREGML